MIPPSPRSVTRSTGAVVDAPLATRVVTLRDSATNLRVNHNVSPTIKQMLSALARIEGPDHAATATPASAITPSLNRALCLDMLPRPYQWRMVSSQRVGHHRSDARSLIHEI